MALRRKTKNFKPEIDGADIEVNKIYASRAVYQDADRQEVEIKMRSVDGEIVTFRVPARLMAQFINDLDNSFEAILPPRFRGSRAAGWEGMGL